MSEPKPSPQPMALQDTFVRRWGELGALWGINRTMAEVQGLLYITGDSFCTDDIMEKLGCSRGSANMALRSLVDWGVVRKTHKRGDRRDYYESLDDVWQIFTRIARGRKRKEVDPILHTLRECLEQEEARRHALPAATNGDNVEPTGTETSVQRLEQMLAFLSLMEVIGREFIDSDDGLAKAFELLGRTLIPKTDAT